ncbi:UDP-glucose:glyco glucosyltransferase 2 isoform X2 [Pelobates cultripes]|nr:UDP-glucose:glyco glucosyltransferase 2 isoform X2 [Pelobates cultripes]
MPPWQLVCCFSYLTLTSFVTQAAAKGVTASLAAKWPETPLLLEASEFIAEEGNERFWQFLGTVQEITLYKNKGTESSYYNLILKKAGQFLTDLQLTLLKFAFSIRAYSPTVQMFQQIAADESPPEGCEAFVSIHGKHTCKTSQIKKILKEASERPSPYLYKVDHIFPTIAKSVPVVILYAEIGTKHFADFHKPLSEKAEIGEIIYVLRHYVQRPSPRKIQLSGYGVELAIKSTEYKAMDDTQVEADNSTLKNEDGISEDVQGFYFDKLIQMYPDLKNNLVEFRKHLIESTNEMVPLKVWELQDLSFQAASKIVSTPAYETLKVLRDLSQNFPIKARSLTRVALNQEMRKEIEENQKHLSETIGINPGDASLYINGLQVDLDVHNAFSILEMIKTEGKALHGLSDLGIKSEDLGKYLRLQVHPEEDSYALDIRHTAITWINDIETDHMYSKWPSSVQELLRPAFPGVIRQIRRNFLNLVFFVDPVQDYAADYMKLAELFYQHNVPLRIGFVFAIDSQEDSVTYSEAGTALWRAFNFAAEDSDMARAFSFLISIYNKLDDGETLTLDIVRSALRYEFPRAHIDQILDGHSEYNHRLTAGATFYKKSGLGPLPQVLFNGVPFNNEEMDVEEMETVILQKIIDATGFFQRAVFMGLLSDHADAVDFIMDQPNVVTRISPTILTNEKTYLNFISKSVTYTLHEYDTFSYLDSQDKSAVIADNMKYVTKEDEDVIYAVTIWIIADFDKPAGRQLLAKAVKHMSRVTKRTMTSFLSDQVKEIEDPPLWSVAREGWGDMQCVLLQPLCVYFKHVDSENYTGRLFHASTTLSEFLTSCVQNDLFLGEKKICDLAIRILRNQNLCVSVVMTAFGGGVTLGMRVEYGKLISYISVEVGEFNEEDFHLLEKITYSTSAEKIKNLVKKRTSSSESSSDLIMKIDSLLSSMPKGESRQDIRFMKQKHSVLKVEPQESGPFFDVMAVVDPLSKEAQKMSHFLIILGRLINMKLTMFMNCKSKLSEMPLKSFYRLVLESEPAFLKDGSLSPGPSAKFLDMPESPLFTLNMITPESWLVEAVHSSCDLDNIHLEDIDGVVTANYELEYLLLEGHCFDVSTGQPPRGLQFTLGTKNVPVIVDTIVMANLGYFQLKANPGAWTLQLRKGRSEEIYHLFS